MGQYLTSRIIEGALKYADVMKTKWGKKFKDVIDKTIDERGYMIDADGKCVKKPTDDSGTGATDTSDTSNASGTTA